LVELVPLEKKYLDIVTKWNYDTEINFYFSKRPPLNQQQQNLWLEKTLNDATKKKYIIIHQLNKKPVGMVSLMKIDVLSQKAEFGITIGEKNYWGTGVAKAASKMLLHYAFQILKLEEVYLTVFEANVRAIHFFTNLGFTKTGNAFTNENGTHLIEMNLFKSNFLILNEVL
jgi:RimJ/RimL family protein N-acetyltransferase